MAITLVERGCNSLNARIVPRTWTNPRMKLIQLLICLGLMTAAPAISQTKAATSAIPKPTILSESEGKVQVNANSPRPLAQTLDALHQKYGWIVNYEDPQYVSKADIVESTDQSGDRLPAGGRFRVDLPGAEDKDKENDLQRIVDAYNQSSNPGRFELRKSAEGVFTVVGVGSADAQGKISPQKPAFDTALTVVTRQRTVSAMLDLIGKRIATERRITVTIGVVPRTLLNIPVSVGGTRVSARDLLLRTLTATHRNLYWRLLFDPKSKSYFLDIHQIAKS